MSPCPPPQLKCKKKRMKRIGEGGGSDEDVSGLSSWRRRRASLREVWRKAGEEDNSVNSEKETEQTASCAAKFAEISSKELGRDEKNELWRRKRMRRGSQRGLDGLG